MNVLDVVIAVIVGFCLVRGVFRGIIKEITSIVGVFVGFFGAYSYYPIVAKLISRLMANEAYVNIISFVLTFTILFFAVGFIGIVLKHLLKAISLGWADRILGGTFGLLKAVLIVSVLLVPLTTFLPKESSLVKNSLLAPHVITITKQIIIVVPEDMKQKFSDNIESLKEAWKEQ
jgi:membrane protein required for colicin V production